MKRYLSLLLALVLLLPGCGKKEDETTGQDAETIAKVMLDVLDENREEDSLTWYLEPLAIKDYLSNFYKLEDLCWADGAIVRMDGARAFELAVLFLDEWDVDSTAEALQQYLLDRTASFTGYFPDQVELLNNALILTKGHCVALAVCKEPDQAKTAFESCFGEGINARGIPNMLLPDPEDYRPDGRLIYVDPGLDDMTLFDSAAILTAWESGDSSALSETERQVLDAAKAVMAEQTAPDMSDYEKELALYTWLTEAVSYDQSEYSEQGAPRTSYEPYGPLVEGKGVCLGFATTFQLLMDMAGVQCITVTGAAYRNKMNHAWNMVKLDGEWYCADPTWDLAEPWDLADPDAPRVFRYFNVTSDWMAQNDHQWDYDAVPEATAEDLGQPG